MKHIYSNTALLFFSFILSAYACSGNNDTIAVSLNQLQNQIKSNGTKSEWFDNICNVTEILGYVIDETGKDIILLGTVDKSKPIIHTEDFVVALRYAWLKYAELRGNTYYYSSPGCSIDPDPLVMQELDVIGSKILSPGNGQLNYFIKKWDRVCEKPQNVRVLGIPFNTAFAKTMVKADYDLKAIADGSDDLGIDGIVSLSNMRMARMISKLNSNQPVSISMNRFWFYPGKNVYEYDPYDKNIVLIKECPVTLQTENEYGSNSGIDPFAQSFAKSITKHYETLAEKRYIYKELENLFPLVAIAKLLEADNTHAFIDSSLSYFLHDYNVKVVQVDKSKKGKSACQMFIDTTTTNNGSIIQTIALPSCGGVDIDIKNATYVYNQSLGNLRRRVLSKLEEGKVSSIIGSNPYTPVRGKQNRTPTSNSRFIKIKKREEEIRKLVKANSDEDNYFLHLSTFIEPENTVKIQFGNSQVSIDYDELVVFLDGQSGNKVLDDLISNQKFKTPKPKLIIYRDAQLQEMNFTETRESSHINPVKFYMALNRIYGKDFDFYLANDFEKAKRNIKNIPQVKGGKDIAVYANRQDYKIKTPYDAIAANAKYFKEANIEIIKADIQSISKNIVVVSGHKDEEMKRYLNSLHEQNILKDKVLVLFSCYEPGDVDFNSNLLQSGKGPKAILFFHEKINPTLVSVVLKLLSELVRNGMTPAEMKKLIDDCIKEAIEGLSEDDKKQKEQLKKFLNNLFQISDLLLDAEKIFLLEFNIECHG